MKTPFKTIAASALLMSPALGFALGLGDIDVQSKLNEPLRAEIRLIYGDADEITSTQVELASPEDFGRVGLDLTHLPPDLSFQVERGDSGEFVVRVTSESAVTEPFLDFLIEVNWANGRLLREYVVLLDPPVVAPAAGPAVSPIAEEPAYQPTPVPDVDETPTATSETPSVSTPTSSGYPSGDNTYGPVVAGDTLWEIARDWRPGADVSINQMMVMLYQMNPDAFYQDNINALKRGAILRLPSQADFDSLSSSEATAEVRSQNQMWESYRPTSTRSTPTVSDIGASSEYDTSSTRPSAADDSRLELVPPEGDSDSDADYAAGSAALQSDVRDLRADLQRTREDLLSANQENSELRSRVSDLEDLVSNLERAITLKDADLADLQAELELARQGVSDLAASADVSSGYDSGYDDADTGADDSGGFDTAADDTGGYDDGYDSATDDTGYDDATDTASTSPAGFDESPADTDMDDGADAMPEPSATSTPAVVNQPRSDDEGILSILLSPFVLGGLAVVFLSLGALIWKRRRDAAAGESLIDAMMDDEDEYVAPPPVAAPEPAPEPEPIAATVASPMVSENSLIEALKANPGDPQSHLALLRMYYSENERDKFVAAAERMLEQIGGSSHPAWAEVKGMGLNLAADHPLFAAEAAGAESEPDTGGGLEFEGAGETADSDDDFSLDLDLGDDSEESSDDDELDLSLELDTDDSDDSGGLDLDLGQEETASDESDELELDLDLDLGDDGSDETEDSSTADEIESLDFDLGDDSGPAAEETAVETGDHTEFELEAVSDEGPGDLGAGSSSDDLDLELDLDMDSTEAAPAEASAEADELDALAGQDLDDLGLDDLDLGEESLAGDEDSVGTKLDLAKAYIEMGDPDGARGMLEEVIAEGDDAQKGEAEKLLGNLD